MTRTPVVEQPLWFGPPDRPLFGWIAAPVAAAASLGVVLCPPMTEEGRSSHRTMRRLATDLAARGIVAVRMDYHGTGDSSGVLDDPGLVGEWRRDVAAAAGLLADAGLARVALVGMRLGATLAAAAIADGLVAEALVLWDPCAGGSAFLREGEALHAVRTDTTARADQPPAPPGSVDTPGFRFPAALAADLRELTLPAPPVAGHRPDRILLLTRQDRPVSRAIRRDWEVPGVEWGRASGQQLLLDTLPSDAEVPAETVTEIVEWLGKSDEPGLARPLRLPVTTTAVLGGGTGAAPPVRERPAAFGPIGLFGMVTEPAVVAEASPPAQPHRPWILFLNVASEHHIGPGRQWVELARGWAALGFRSVRLDQSGVGDSPVHPGQVEGITCAREWLQDVPAVVNELRADGSPVVIVGLCSGAYSGLETAMVTEVAALLGVNARVSLPQMSKGTELYDPRRRVAKPPIAPLGRLARRHRKLGGGLWRIYRQFVPAAAPMASLAGVLRTGTELYLVSNRFDARPFREVALWTLFRTPFLRRDPRFRMVVDPSVDHSLLTVAGQQAIRRRFTEFLLDRFPTAADYRRPRVDGAFDDHLSSDVRFRDQSRNEFITPN